MTDASRSTQSSPQLTERLRAQAIAALTPFFIDGHTCDETSARVVAEGMLDDYNAATPKELQLSTQIIALGWASLACLSAAMVVKDESLDEMLRLQNAALTLHRSSHKATKALEARRKERMKNPRALTPENARWDEGVFQLVINQAMEKMNDANARLAAFMVASPPAKQTPKLSFVTSEPMTPGVLARRQRRNRAAAKNA
jgi:hypothetical protein